MIRRRRRPSVEWLIERRTTERPVRIGAVNSVLEFNTAGQAYGKSWGDDAIRAEPPATFATAAGYNAFVNRGIDVFTAEAERLRASGTSAELAEAWRNGAIGHLAQRCKILHVTTRPALTF